MEPVLASALFEGLIGLGLTVVLVGVYTIYSKVKELYEWHSKEDEEGVKIWYTRNTKMEEALERMADICERMDRREDRSIIIQNETIKLMQDHTHAITKLVAVVEALTIITKRNGK